jgi:hypothetical protein
MNEVKNELNRGVLIGLGIGLCLAGFLGWGASSLNYDTLRRYFLAIGHDPSSFYLFRELIDQIAVSLVFMLTGVVVLLVSALASKNLAFREFLYRPYQGPHARLVNGLFAAGGSFALFSLISLFNYILASDYLELKFFTVWFLAAVVLLTCGYLITKRK